MTKLCVTEFQSSMSTPGTLLTSFVTFLSSSPWLRVSSNLKTGQAQVEWSEQSQDLNSEFYRPWQTPEITPSNYVECGPSIAAVLLTKYCYPPSLGFRPRQTLSAPRAAVTSLKVMDTTIPTSRAQTEFWRSCWTSPGCLTCTYSYTMVNTPCYKAFTINTTNNLQITQMAEFLRVSSAIGRSWAKFTSGTTRWDIT